MKYLAMLFIRAYQYVISPLIPPHCRYTPSCSHYGYQAFQKYGFLKGLLLTVSRISRCHPWSRGGYDPLPDDFSTTLSE